MTGKHQTWYTIIDMRMQEFDLDDTGGISQVELSDVLAMFEGPNRDPAM